MLKKCTTAEDMRKLENEINYFYNHGGPTMDDNGIPYCTECAMTETDNVPTAPKAMHKTSTPSGPRTDHTKWRDVVHGGLEAEIAYFYEHGGPIMD